MPYGTRIGIYGDNEDETKWPRSKWILTPDYWKWIADLIAEHDAAGTGAQKKSRIKTLGAGLDAKFAAEDDKCFRRMIVTPTDLPLDVLAWYRGLFKS